MSVDFCQKGQFCHTTSGLKSYSYARAVSNTNLYMDIKSMISCKKFERSHVFYFHPLTGPNHAILALVLSMMILRATPAAKMRPWFIWSHLMDFEHAT
jgi:hypothetical protein